MTRIVRIDSIADFLLKARAQGMSPALALKEALVRLHLQGHTVITPTIHAQLTAGLQKQVILVKPGMGDLGITGRQIYSSGAAGASAAAAAASVSTVAASALTSIGAFAAIGQSSIPIPAVGAVIGAVVGAIAILSRRHVGKAEASWRNPNFYASLRRMNGRDYDEKQYSEAFKGMMDTGNNIIPGCGPDRHKNPDCFLGPLAGVIAQAYLTGSVPLSATTTQVFNQAVLPWLQGGAGGMVNWPVLAGEPIQQSMISAATDRYLAGQAMTRGDMPSYGNHGAHTPSLLQALQPILQQATAPAAPLAPSPEASVPTPLLARSLSQPGLMASSPATILTSVGSSSFGTPLVPIDQTAALMAQLQAQGATQQQALQAAAASLQSHGINTAAPQVQRQLQADLRASTPSGINWSQYLLPGAILGGGFLLYSMKRKT